MDEIFFDASNNISTHADRANAQVQGAYDCENAADPALQNLGAKGESSQMQNGANEGGDNRFLGEQNIFKLLLKFSIPCILSLLVGALYNIVDQIFIGNSSLHELGNAATGVCFPLTLIAMAFAWGFGDGTAAYLSICQGRKDTEDAHRAVGTAMTMTLLFSLILIAVLLPLRTQILRLFGASDNTIGYAGDYFVIIVAAFPIYMVSNMMTGVIRADGAPGFSMAALVAGALTNIVLDAAFIYGAGLGIKGAAWATVIGEGVTFVVCAVYFFRTKTFRLHPKSFVPAPKILLEVAKLGVSSFITQISIVAISLTGNIILAKYGALSKYGPDVPIALIGIETKVFTIVLNIVIGIVLGAQPIFGYNYGARNFKRIRDTFLIVLALTVGVGLISTVLFEACPQVIYRIFGEGDPTHYYDEFASKLFRIFLMFVTFTCVIKMSAVFLQAVGQPAMAMTASLFRDIVCFIPLTIGLPVAMDGIDGALWAAPIADGVAILMTAALIFIFFVKFKKQCRE